MDLPAIAKQLYREKKKLNSKEDFEWREGLLNSV